MLMLFNFFTVSILKFEKVKYRIGKNCSNAAINVKYKTLT